MRKYLFIFIFVATLFTSLLSGCGFERKKNPLSFITFENSSATYDGKEHSIFIKGELPEGLSVTYENNGQTNAGEYEVKATIDGVSEEYYLPYVLTAKLTIYKKKINVEFSDEEFTYDGQAHSIYVKSDLPEGVLVGYENNKRVEIGTHTVVANFVDTTGNYQIPESLTANLTINKIDVTNIRFYDSKIEYDGEEHSIFITGELPEGIEVSYENNGAKDIGVYTVVAHFSGDLSKYNIPNYLIAKLEITKIYVEPIVFESVTIPYDGQPHSIYISNELPEGLEVSYSNNGKTLAGEYRVTASFTDTLGIYFVPSNQIAVLKITKIQLANVSFHDAVFKYDGKPHSIEIVGDLPDDVIVKYQNNEQIESGKYKVTVSFSCSHNGYSLPSTKTAFMYIYDPNVDIVGNTSDFTIKTDGIYAWISSCNIDEEEIAIPDYISSNGKVFVVKTILMNSFVDKHNLQTIIPSKYLLSVNYAAFVHCNNLNTVKLREFTSLSNDTISYLDELYDRMTIKTLIIEGGLNEITFQFGGIGFSSSDIIENLYFKGTINDWAKIKINSASVNPLICCKKFYVLDDNGEFYEATNIVLDETVSSIGKYQFYKYENLLSITLQKNIVEIPSQLYKYCERLSSIYYNGTIDDIKNVSYTWYKNSERITIFVKDENGSWVALDK